MNTDKLEKIINENFERKEKVNPKSDKKIIKAINETIDLVDQGKIRVANKINGSWVVNQWIKKAILLSFRVNKMTMSKGPYTTWYDKVPGKSVLWNEDDWKKMLDFRKYQDITIEFPPSVDLGLMRLYV